MKNIILFFLCGLVLKAQTGENPNNSPLNILAKIKIQDLEKPPTTFDTSWVDSLQLSLPCKNAPVPERTMRLPNAPRDYRSGTHRGIDFFANWGTPVHTVAPGIVVRADHHFKEVPADFRENLLHTSARVGHTPSDIFSSVLLGQAIFIDHGFDLVPGFRVITIYAHLSGIEAISFRGKGSYRGHLLAIPAIRGCGKVLWGLRRGPIYTGK